MRINPLISTAALLLAVSTAVTGCGENTDDSVDAGGGSAIEAPSGEPSDAETGDAPGEQDETPYGGGTSGSDDMGAGGGSGPVEEGECAMNGKTAEGYEGLSKADAAAKAKEADVPFRVVSEDGERMMVTMDFNPERVNVDLVDGKVTCATHG